MGEYENYSYGPPRYKHGPTGTAELASFLRQTPQQVQSTLSPEEAFEHEIRQKMARMSQQAQARRAREWEQEFGRVLREAMRTDSAPAGQLALAQDRYKLEKLDPRHRMGDLLMLCLNEYERRKPSMGFFEWIASMPEFEVMKLFVGQMGASGNSLLPSVVKAFVHGVSYLDDGARQAYAVAFRNGRMYRGDALFDTAVHSTVFSGPGWAIYVLSPQQRFYAASHKLGTFHHSSFLQGSPVACAGELEVKQGQLVTLTAKTGHYQTPRENFVRCVQFLRDVHQIDPASYKVSVYPHATHRRERVPADTFLQNPNRYEVWG